VDEIASDLSIGRQEADGQSLEADHTGQDVRDLFQKNPGCCGVLIVENGQLLGVVSRATFLRQMSRPFGPDVYSRRPASYLLREVELDPLVLPSEMDVHEAVRRALQRPGDSAFEPIVVRHPDGSLRLLSATRLLLAQSQLLAGANEIIRQQKRAADAASTAKGQFLANMSHEIRTPMNGIIGMVDLLLETPLSDTQQEYLSMVKTSADWLVTVINDVLDFSKIEAGKLDIEPLAFSLRSMLEEWLKPLSFRAMGKDLRLNWHVNADIPDGVVADPTRLRQILVNLVGNAIKFTEHGGIDVEVKRLRVGNGGSSPLEAGQIVLGFAVRDTGIGIPPEALAKIFHEFEQVDGSHSRRFGGTGLGLAISQRLCEMMGGRIGVESVLGQGSNFFFELPCGVATGQETLATGIRETRMRVESGDGTRPRETPIRYGLRVLVAEDNPVNQKLVRLLLEKRRHQIEMVDNGQAAVDACMAHEFDIALVDIQMPILDGLSATRIIRERQAPLGRHTPIVALTAHAMKGDRERCLAAGMDGYVGKPLVAAELYRTMDELALPESSRAATPTEPLPDSDQSGSDSNSISAPMTADCVAAPSRSASAPQNGDHPRGGPPADAVRADAMEELWKRALKHTGGDRDLLAQMAVIFLDSLPNTLKQLRHAASEGQPNVVRRLSHSIKGSCGYFAADEAFAAASALEQSHADDRVAERLQVLEQELERATPVIARFAGR
jgi:signal transduction histidine kinase/DNA-binding NarL/FixJ family response regulator/HPt (histidine-containing phosphotransfer) domain-containing protein